MPLRFGTGEKRSFARCNKRRKSEMQQVKRPHVIGPSVGPGGWLSRKMFGDLNYS